MGRRLRTPWITATVEGSTITFRNVRDFTWRTTRDRDENWADEVTVDAEELKQVWFIVDHFHSIKGLAHTYLTFEFGWYVPFLSASNPVEKKASDIIRGTACGVHTNSIFWSVLNETKHGFANPRTPEQGLHVSL